MSTGVDIKFTGDTDLIPSPHKKNDSVVRKIFIEENRIQNCTENAISISSKVSKQKTVT